MSRFAGRSPTRLYRYAKKLNLTAFRRAVRIFFYDIDLSDRHIEMLSKFKHLEDIDFYERMANTDRIQRIEELNPRIKVKAVKMGV